MMTPSSGLSRLMCWSKSRPLRSGRLMSSNTRSKRPFSMRFRPSSPVAAESALYPSSSRSCSRLSRISVSSSITRIEPLADIHGFPDCGKFQPEGRSATLHAVHLDRSGMLPDDAVSYRETQACASARGLGSKKRIENLVEVIGGDSHAVVGNFHVHGGVLSLCSNGQLAAARHGIARVQDQVHKNLLEFAGIPVHGGQRGFQLGMDGDPGDFQHGFDQGEAFADNAVHVTVGVFAAADARKLEK